jgi:hypothetical protein
VAGGIVEASYDSMPQILQKAWKRTRTEIHKVKAGCLTSFECSWTAGWMWVRAGFPGPRSRRPLSSFGSTPLWMLVPEGHRLVALPAILVATLAELIAILA